MHDCYKLAGAGEEVHNKDHAVVMGYYNGGHCLSSPAGVASTDSSGPVMCAQEEEGLGCGTRSRHILQVGLGLILSGTGFGAGAVGSVDT